MAVTSPNNIFYPDSNGPVDVPQAMSTAASSVENAIGDFVGDTGWVDCPLASGVFTQGTSMPQVRKLGKVVYMRWGVSGTGIVADSNKTVCTIPVGYRPPAYKYFQVSSGSANFPGRLVVRSDGAAVLYTPSTASSYYIFDAASWLID